MDHKDRDSVLAQDLKTMTARTADRRKVLGWLVAASLAPALGCGDDSSEGSGGATSTGTTGTTSTTGDGSCSTIPEETAGPYPGDGSNGANALTLSGIVRSDITPSIGAAGGTAEGIPLTIRLTLVNAGGSCAALAGYAVYLWHCDRNGDYSMYSAAIADENYLRGVQETGSDGTVTFTSIFPACYSGRWPHIHFEVYPSLATATSGSNSVATSQLALPEAACDEVYATADYSSSVSSFAGVSLDSDNVFSDGSSSQLATVTGNVTDGYVATLTVAIDA